MSASTSKSPAKFTTRGSSHKRKKSEEVDIPRKRASTAQSVDRCTEEIRDVQSREAGDGEGPSMNRGNRDAHNREAVDPDWPDPSIPTEASTSTVATETRSITLFQGSSNFQISNTNITAIGGDATIQFGGEYA
ncbi:hypothetical protein M378DRAFT_174200 [Amanita muscaria Koide BX008]|uniref:Uncharacterized protein n=1 Tax=Amanita muscaria (strain Koide BX008) TaxID=946122 RepID=A0A0C2WD73_AMAMK|nr:hypothetical protein M378DRAFT_174200 [Amanita muscaria Koide BX008]